MWRETMTDEITKLELKIENLYKKDLDYKIEMDSLRRDRDLYKLILMDCVKRIQALEHPCMDEPLQQFQKLRKTLAKIDESNLPPIQCL
jgi:hypothetical protein